jgi:AcrR family transcriptional regulator
LSRTEIGLRKREKTRMRLLEAAARVLGEAGDRSPTTEDFIQAAAVARGTFYNYYTTSKELTDDLWRWYGQSPFVEIHQACRAIQDPAERLCMEARVVLMRASHSPAWGWLVFRLSATGQTVNADLLGYPRPDLALGLNQGRFAFDNLDCATDLVVGAIRTALRALLLGEREGEDYASGVLALVLRALGISAEEAMSISRAPLPMDHSVPSWLESFHPTEQNI